MGETDSKFGVRGRLLLAFLGISALAVVGAVASLFTFAEVSSVIAKAEANVATTQRNSTLTLLGLGSAEPCQLDASSFGCMWAAISSDD